MAVKEIYTGDVYANGDKSDPFLPPRMTTTAATLVCRYSLCIGLIIGIFVQLSTLGFNSVLMIMNRSMAVQGAVEPTTGYYAPCQMTILVIFFVRQLLVAVMHKKYNRLVFVAEASFLLGCLLALSGMHLATLSLLHEHQTLILRHLALNAMLVLSWSWVTWKIYHAERLNVTNEKHDNCQSILFVCLIITH